MYHEKTIQELKRERIRYFMLLVALVLVAALSVAAFEWIQKAEAEQGAQALRSSILAAATRCCAIEGSYPQSLEYLEEHYGLRVNDRDYVVKYEAFASNVVPSVVVVPR